MPPVGRLWAMLCEACTTGAVITCCFIRTVWQRLARTSLSRAPSCVRCFAVAAFQCGARAPGPAPPRTCRCKLVLLGGLGLWEVYTVLRLTLEATVCAVFEKMATVGTTSTQPPPLWSHRVFSVSHVPFLLEACLKRATRRRQRAEPVCAGHLGVSSPAFTPHCRGGSGCMPLCTPPR